MSKSRELLVLGGGMSGTVAALAAAERGRKVRLLRKAPGATALSSGAFDLAPGAWADTASKQPAPLQARLEGLLKRLPAHPLSRIGAPDAGVLDEAFRFVVAKLGAAGLEHAPFDAAGPGHLVVDGRGGMRRVASAQASQVLGDIDPSGVRCAIVRCRPVASGDTGLLRGRTGSFKEVEHVEIDWPKTNDAPFLLPVELGRMLDEREERGRFSDLLTAAVSRRGLDVVILPAMAGLHRPELTKELSRATGCKVVEALGGEASLPGLRLHMALQRCMEAAGVEIVTGTGRAGELPVPDGDPVVLATGRFIGGGLERGDLLREVTFDLPVHDGEGRLFEQQPEIITRRSALESHRLFRAGVRVDERLRPLALGDEPARDGLFAAGAVIGGHDPHSDLCGMGVAIVTGYLAGLQAAEWEAGR
ncbi:MAG: FAD-binding protein [Myxococcota bacterium]